MYTDNVRKEKRKLEKKETQMNERKKKKEIIRITQKIKSKYWT